MQTLCFNDWWLLYLHIFTTIVSGLLWLDFSHISNNNFVLCTCKLKSKNSNLILSTFVVVFFQFKLHFKRIYFIHSFFFFLTIMEFRALQTIHLKKTLYISAIVYAKRYGQFESYGTHNWMETGPTTLRLWRSF